MDIPEKLTRYFSAGALKEGFRIFQEQQCTDFAFFRKGYACRILTNTNNAKKYNSVCVLSPDKKKIEYHYCTCSALSGASRLCSHIAALTFYAFAGPENNGNEISVGERFEESLWHLLGCSLFDSSGSKTLSHNILKKDEITCFQTKSREGNLILEIQISDGCLKKYKYLNLLFSAYPEISIKPIASLGSVTKETAFSNNEKLLRRVTITDNEEYFSVKGSKTIKQEWEDSFWYTWCKSCFYSFGEQADRFRITCKDNNFIFEFADKDEAPSFKIRLYPAALTLERMLRGKHKNTFIKNNFAVLDEKADISFKIRFDEEQNLRLIPVLILQEKRKKEYFEINELKTRHFGRYYYLEDYGFISAKPTAVFFAEKEANSQTSFNFDSQFRKSAVGIPTNTNTFIPQDEVLGFIDRHSEELKQMDEALVPPSIKRPEILDLDSNLVFNFDKSEKGWCHLAIYYKDQNEVISFFDLYQARKTGKKYLIMKNKWIPTSSSSLDWLDSISEKSITGDKKNKRIKLTPLECLRLRHSIPGKVSYTGRPDVNKFFRNLENFKPPQKAPRLEKLGISLRHYQAAGYEWLWFLYKNGFGGLLCDDMGLGKTHQAMALMKAVNKSSSKKTSFMIICPTSVLSHWQSKLEEYCPEMKTLLYHGPNRKLPDRKTNIVLTSYGTLRNDFLEFEEYSYELLIIDEIQILKNKTTSSYRALKNIKSAVSIGLTGTPIENSVVDLKNLLDFVLPGYLPGDAEFKKRFEKPIESNNEGVANAKQTLSRIISPFVLRRTKQQVLPELPEKIEDKRYCFLTDDQVKLYKDIINNQGAKAMELLREGKNIPYIHVFAALNYLKQVCNHPAMLKNHPGDFKKYRSGKWELFCEILEECMNSKLKVVIFSQYVKMLKLIEMHLDEKKIKFATIKGSTRNRKEMLERFQQEEACMVFTCSLRAGGLGIDLTAASVVIHYDRWWNQAREDQATDRVHRIGQNKGVQVIKLLTRGTLEEKIDSLIQKKQAVANSIVKSDDHAISKQFTREELKSLLTF